jgi:hypothetical protein
MYRTALAALCLLPGSAAADGDRALPVVANAEWAPLRDHCRALLRKLDEAKAPLPAEPARGLRELLDKEPADPQAAAEAAQKLLDRHCLVGVTINPESRVKAARGPAPAGLVRGRAAVFLVKVQNDAGVTHPLAAAGPGLRGAGGEGAAGWLDAALTPAGPGPARLGGGRVEYVLLRLTAREAGKREATFRFDVGQGTQDLGFRAEVPVLFTVREP